MAWTRRAAAAAIPSPPFGGGGARSAGDAHPGSQICRGKSARHTWCNGTARHFRRSGAFLRPPATVEEQHGTTVGETPEPRHRALGSRICGCRILEHHGRSRCGRRGGVRRAAAAFPQQGSPAGGVEGRLAAGHGSRGLKCVRRFRANLTGSAHSAARRAAPETSRPCLLDSSQQGLFRDWRTPDRCAARWRRASTDCARAQCRRTPCTRA
jgi:hypothetical protein